MRKSLPALVDEVASTKRPVLITRRGEPVAQLNPYVERAPRVSVYPLRSVPVEIAADFDAELPIQWHALV